jgi:hypothetical protein
MSCLGKRACLFAEQDREILIAVDYLVPITAS